MGWDSSTAWTKKADAVFDTTQSLKRNGHEIIGFASTVQGAYWVIRPKGSTTSIICCAIFQIDRRTKQVWKKVMYENMGPAMDDCPPKLIAMADETPHEWANNFRAGCLKRAQMKLQKRDLTGRVLTLYGHTYQVIGTYKRSYMVKRIDNGRTYRLTQRQESLVEIKGEKI